MRIGMPVYNKAIRDRIPEIIHESSQKCEIRVLSDDEFLPLLEVKLGEEIEEYLSSRSVVELADLVEVVIRIAELRGVSREELEGTRLSKRSARGGFENNLFLVRTY